jgi:GNAT superfamily N-acetyltransferase
MDEILHEANPDRLIIANEENLAAFLPVFAKLGEFHVNNPPGVKRSITDLPMALFNSIMDARLEPAQVEPAVQVIIEDARCRKVPVIWWVGPSTQPSDLGERLEELGFLHDEEVPAMGVDLLQINELTPVVPGLVVEPARADDSWEVWCQVMAVGFDVPAPHDLFIKSWQDLMRQADPETTLAFTGFLYGEPVATSLLFMAAGVAGIYSVSTVPAARRKGIAARMTLQPLLYARHLGYRVGILQSSKMGLHVYTSLGFAECCRINMYAWHPEKDSTEPEST